MPFLSGLSPTRKQPGRLCFLSDCKTHPSAPEPFLDAGPSANIKLESWRRPSVKSDERNRVEEPRSAPAPSCPISRPIGSDAGKLLHAFANLRVRSLVGSIWPDRFRRAPHVITGAVNRRYKCCVIRWGHERQQVTLQTRRLRKPADPRARCRSHRTLSRPSAESRQGRCLHTTQTLGSSEEGTREGCVR